MNPVNWFEIPVRKMERAKRFYDRVFEVNLALTDMGPAEMAWFPMSAGNPGAGGTLIKSDGYTPSHAGSVVYFSVPSIEACAARTTESGGRILLPKTGIGEHGFIAQIEDSEGNRVGLHART
jgi:predicted enzyme related to lactoylglutathione lyase